MPAPAGLIDANGILVVVGQGRSVTGRVTAVDATTGNVTLLLNDAYLTVDAQRTSITAKAYNCREGKAGTNS